MKPGRKLLLSPKGKRPWWRQWGGLPQATKESIIYYPPYLDPWCIPRLIFWGHLWPGIVSHECWRRLTCDIFRRSHGNSLANHGEGTHPHLFFRHAPINCDLLLHTTTLFHPSLSFGKYWRRRPPSFFLECLVLLLQRDTATSRLVSFLLGAILFLKLCVFVHL